MNHSIIASVLTVTMLVDESTLLTQTSRSSRTFRLTKGFRLKQKLCPRKLSRKSIPELI